MLPAETLAFVQRVEAAENLYGVLGLLPTAQDVDIRAAYKAAALALHPDRTGAQGEQEMEGRATAAFKIVGAAHELLLDKDKRAMYDLSLLVPRMASKGLSQDHIVGMRQWLHEAVLRPPACVAVGCTNRIEVPNHHGLCMNCLTQRLQRCKCPTCGVLVDTAGSSCLQCALTAVPGKSGRCKNMGCFNMAPNPLKTDGQCEKCYNAPRKCSKLGCFDKCLDRSMNPPLCEQHQAGAC
jgi:hypothetical protein